MAISAQLHDDRSDDCNCQSIAPTRAIKRPATRPLFFADMFSNAPAGNELAQSFGIASDFSIIEASDRLTVGSAVTSPAYRPAALRGPGAGGMRPSVAAK